MTAEISALTNINKHSSFDLIHLLVACVTKLSKLNCFTDRACLQSLYVRGRYHTENIKQV